MPDLTDLTHTLEAIWPRLREIVRVLMSHRDVPDAAWNTCYEEVRIVCQRNSGWGEYNSARLYMCLLNFLMKHVRQIFADVSGCTNRDMLRVYLVYWNAFKTGTCYINWLFYHLNAQIVRWRIQHHAATQYYAQHYSEQQDGGTQSFQYPGHYQYSADLQYYEHLPYNTGVQYDPALQYQGAQYYAGTSYSQGAQYSNQYTDAQYNQGAMYAWFQYDNQDAQYNSWNLYNQGAQYNAWNQYNQEVQYNAWNQYDQGAQYNAWNQYNQDGDNNVSMAVIPTNSFYIYPPMQQVEQLALTIWKFEMLYPLRLKLLKALLEEIEAYRSVSTDVFSNQGRIIYEVCLSLLHIGNVMHESTDLYTSIFESEYLEETERYFRALANQLLCNSKNNVAEYVRTVLATLGEEEVRMYTFLPTMSHDRSFRLVHERLIINHREYLEEHCMDLIRNCAPNSEYDLNRACQLLRMTVGVGRVLDQFEEHIRQIVTDVVQQSGDEDDKVGKLEEIHCKYDVLVTRAFGGDRSFSQAMSSALSPAHIQLLRGASQEQSFLTVLSERTQEVLNSLMVSEEIEKTASENCHCGEVFARRE